MDARTLSPDQQNDKRRTARRMRQQLLRQRSATAYAVSVER